MNEWRGKNSQVLFMFFITGTHQISIPCGVEVLEAHISSHSVCVSLWNIPLCREKRGCEGQLGTANLLREKLNVLFSPINTPLCVDDRRLLGLIYSVYLM